ncbi:MAG: hypothetical protein H6613_08335 [Ignavibacteriales bacterium]|nr:hypothetical protein [Ignavibacteriales bacterium]
MKKLKLFLPILTLLLLMGCGENQDSQINKGTISDDLHQQFNFNEPPKRIISLAPKFN